ncbi:hypothetical protein HOD20_06835 [archaeon]|jgi:aspartokinase|nr:hypothetical protein [archaeon]MBT4352220.1 hypothetical protein [archaeon]MBT4647343.1 hypothetical protein [archaeon]MBT6821221.1 hypothetical protein [archaeon]MBT7391273.1 hypothetical protein [archaeon]
MVTISHIVKKKIEGNPLIFESLCNKIASYANLAEYLQPSIEEELGKDVRLPAVVMAIRRYSEGLIEKNTLKSDFKFDTEIIMKTGLVDVTIEKTPSSIEKIKKIYQAIDFGKGYTLNIIQGNYEITFVFSDKYEDKIIKILDGEKILSREKDLVSLTMSFSKEFLFTPGIIATVTRKIFWEGINIYENISTMTELIYIIHKKDVLKAYKALESLVEETQ